MEFLAKHFNNLKTNLFESYSKDASAMLLHTGTFAWAMSALAQIVGIIGNDKISKDQKKFLVPQEMADAAINIASFYMVTNTLQNFTQRLASKGKIITPSIEAFCKKHGILVGEKSTNIGKTILNKVDEFKATIKINKEENILMPTGKKEELDKKIEILNKFYDKTYSPFESGMKIIGSIAGAVLSSNIITPILRNPIAAMKQKTAMAQDKTELAPIDRPIYLAQNRFGINDYMAKTALPSGSMKI